MPGQGITSKAAFKIENTAWGTSTDCGAGDQIHFISESVSHAIEQGMAVHLDGNVEAKSLYPVAKKYGGDLLIEAHYAGMEPLIAAAMGISHQDLSPVDVSTAGELHYFELSEDMSMRTFLPTEMTTPSGTAYRKGTLCFEKDTSVWEIASAMINAISFDASPERVTFSFTVAGKTISFDSATNPNSSSWTLPSNTEQITWEDMTVYLKARDEFTITSANDIFVINEGGSGDRQIDVADGTYTGEGLAQAIAAGANAIAAISGVYKMEYDELTRKFRIWNTSTQTFYVGGAIGAHEMDSVTGFTTTTAVGLSHGSDYPAIPDAYAALAAADKVGISKLSWSLENGLDVESQDSESDLDIIEPERNDFRRVTGTIEIPRYKNDTFLKACNGFTTYMLWVNFTGSTIDTVAYQLNFYLPAVKFTNVDAPITGAELIKQTLAFEAEVPHIIDSVNFIFDNYSFRNTATAAQVIGAMAPYNGKLYCGAAAGFIYAWDPVAGSFSTSCDIGAAVVGALQQYNNKLYAGDSTGQIWEFDGTTWSTSCDVGTGGVVDFAVYDGKLYALETTTGKVFEKDGTGSWSSSCDTTATSADQLEVYNDNLYMIGSDGSTFTRVYKFDGTTWSTSCDFGAWGTQTSLTVHRGKLYACYDHDLFNFGGTTWVQLEIAMTPNIQDLISYKGELYMLEDGAGDLYYYDHQGSGEVNIYTGLNLTSGLEMGVFWGVLFIAHNATSMKMLVPPKELTITIQNQNGTNPL